EQKENIVFVGTSGVGKTHLATSIGIAAAKKRTSTYFIKCHDLISNLKKAKLENRLDTRLKHYTKYKLLILDEIGYLPIDSEEEDNIVFVGTSGVGKTHLATSIGIAAAKKRTSTYFIKCHDLISNLKKAKLENRLDTRLKHYTKYKLLILDEIGYLPIDSEEAKLFFQLIDRRYENKSTIFTTNSNFKSWKDIFQDTKVANAILD